MSVLPAGERFLKSSLHSHRMLAFQVIQKRLTLIQKSLPKLRPRWALVRVRMAGICNTDVEILRGYHNFRGTPGHEFVGEVQQIAGASAALKKRWIGKRVAGEINIACRALGFSPVCRFCKRGLARQKSFSVIAGDITIDGSLIEGNESRMNLVSVKSAGEAKLDATAFDSASGHVDLTSGNVPSARLGTNTDSASSSWAATAWPIRP